MNHQRRKKLQEAINLIAQASAIITRANDEEHNCMDNLPDFQEERQMAFEDNIEHMEEAIENLSDAISELAEAMQ